MRHGNLRGPMARRHLRQKSIAKVAGGMLDGETLFPGAGNNLQLAALAGKPQGLSRFPHQSLFRLRFLGPQAMIHMGNHQRTAKHWGQLRQNLQQGHGIRSSGHRHNAAFSNGKKRLMPDNFFCFFQERMHASRSRCPR